MADNVIMKLTLNISPGTDADTIKYKLENLLENIPMLYSYIVFKKNDEFVIQLNISQTERYNTLTVNKCINDIVNKLINTDNIQEGKVLCYDQPPIEILVEAFDPLVNKLALQQLEHWKQYEHDDLCQTCRLVMVTLYNKGYYLHKSLISKAFSNEILMEIRHDRDKPLMLSLDDAFYRPIKGGSEELTYADIVKDDCEELIQREREISEAEMLIFNEVKDIIVDLIGIRQWNEFYRDYANKHTTSWSRHTLLKIKNHLASLGLTRGKFNDKYYK